jgi:hypothetical protein
MRNIDAYRGGTITLAQYQEILRSGESPNGIYDGTGINDIVNDSTIIIDGHKEVARSGTPVALGANTPFKILTVRANQLNTGQIYIGNDTSQSYYLDTGETVTYTNGNLINIYIDAELDGNGVVFYGEF